MHVSQKQILIVTIALMVVVFLVVLVVANVRKSPTAASFHLVVWGTDPPEYWAGVLGAYNAMYKSSKSSVAYLQIPADGYDATLLNALAAGNGPDIYMIGNRDLPKYRDKIVPVDPTVFSLNRFRSLFPTVAEQDFVSGGTIFGVPLYVDTMAMIYNRDFFDQAAIVAPPQTWDDFQRMVPKLAQIDQNGHIIKSAVAMGGSEKTVDSGMDLVQLLMMQNGSRMTTADFTAASFSSGKGGHAGADAVNFYLQFANAGSPLYTWDEGQPYSLDSFASGKTAVIFDYKSALPVIKAKSPFLNIGIASMPQPKDAAARIDFPKYHGLVVSKQSPSQVSAWDFLMFAATDPNMGSAYMAASGRPPVLRQVIGTQLDSVDMGIFAKQALTARSWYEVDNAQIDIIFNKMVQSILSGQVSTNDALNQAEAQISVLMRPKNQTAAPPLPR